MGDSDADVAITIIFYFILFLIYGIMFLLTAYK